MEKDKWLIAIDLDGTILKNSATGEINPIDKKAIARAQKEGHVVVIITGRPWRSTEKVYNELKLNTIVANYNGARIHNPTDYDFNPEITQMNMNDVLYILGDEKLKDSMSNLAIEGPGWVMLQKRDEDLERVFGFRDVKKLKLGIDYHKIPLRPTGVVFDTKPGINIPELKEYLERKYGDLVEFSSWSKGKGLTPVFDMTSIGVTKAKAITLMARYYDIPVNRTISIGDGYNDVPMLIKTEISVAMANSSDDIKEVATYNTKNDNTKGGVAEFLTKFLDDKDGSFVEEQRKIRKTKHTLITKTTPSH